MLKLIKNMRRKEKEMALLCLVFVVVQIYFDLRLPDYMTELTMLIKTSGTTADIAAVGLKMLGCTAASAVLAIACGFLAAKTASGFSFAVREKLFRHVMDIGSEEMQDFSIPSLITRTTNDITQIQMIIAMGLQMMIKAPIMAVWAIIKILGKSWELSAVTAAFVVVLFTTLLLIMGSCIPRFRLVQKMTDKINRVARENLTGINVVHAFNAEEFQNEKFDGPSRRMMDLQMKNQKLFALVQPSMLLGMNGLALAIYWVGAALVNSIAVTDMAARLTDYMRSSMGVIILALILAALSAVMTILGPNQIGRIATLMSDGLTGNIDLAAIAKVGIFLAVIYVLSAVFSFIQHYTMSVVTLKMSYRMRGELSAKINRVPQKYFGTTSQGDILSRITNDVSTLQQGLTNSLPTITSAATQFAAVSL